MAKIIHAAGNNLSNISNGNAAPKSIERLISVRQARAALSCGKTTVYKLIADGTLEVRKLGRSTRITVASIDRLVTGA